MAALPAFGQSRKPAPKPEGTPWTQWGGPNRNFQTESGKLKATWPAAGPEVVWKRPLGDGYSSPSVENGQLFTMYARMRDEVVLAADAATGKTIWEHSTSHSFHSEAAEMGNGPYATPLIAGDRVVTAGVSGKLQSIDRKTGRPLWTQELWTAHKGTRMPYGYASSPIAFRDLIIVPAGGKGKALMAFRQTDGGVVWARHDTPNAYSSPLLINVDGLEQLVIVMDGAVFAVNPHNGDMQWRVSFSADYGISVATPLYGPDNLLFVSAEYGAGAKMIELKRTGLKTTATELWTSPRIRLHHGNAMRIGDSIYLTSGGKGGPAILTAVEARTGKIHWQERSIAKATFVWADGKLITLDQNGTLMLAHPSPQGFKVAAKAELLTSLSWTPPVLVGTRLYLRDRKSLMAVELS
jgi:hypothetical protein